MSLLPQHFQHQQQRDCGRRVKLHRVSVPRDESSLPRFPSIIGGGNGVFSVWVMELIEQSHQVPFQHGDSYFPHQWHIHRTWDLEQLTFIDILER